MADDALVVLDAVGIKKAHVIGFSMGGHISQELCLRHPESVLSLGLHHTWAKTAPGLVIFRRLERGSPSAVIWKPSPSSACSASTHTPTTMRTPMR
jgi:pimeloyl-ACP methyl ester carboxylesterase